MIVYLFVFLYGITIGSFLNVLIYRIPKGISPYKGRSFCPNCKHQLSWHDLIPVFSFIFQRGRCKYCKVQISYRYPIVELLNGIIFVLILFVINNNIYLFLLVALFLEFLLVFTLIKLDRYKTS